jgi:hypothetical protein
MVCLSPSGVVLLRETRSAHGLQKDRTMAHQE